jgi:SAM-dependent methyltransferase
VRSGRDSAALRSWEEEGVVVDGLPDGWRRHARAVHLDLVARWIGTPRGLWLKTDLQEERTPVRSLLTELEGDWIGTDVAMSVVSDAGQTLPKRVASDVRRLPLASSVLEGVLSTSTLDHFHGTEEIEDALRELHRVLRPGARLVLTLDNPENPLIRLRNGLPERWRRATGLVQFHVGPTLSAREGTAMLERTGFDVLACEHILHAPHVVGTRAARWGWVERRALPWFDRLGGTRFGRISGHYVAFLATPTGCPRSVHKGS